VVADGCGIQLVSPLHDTIRPWLGVRERHAAPVAPGAMPPVPPGAFQCTGLAVRLEGDLGLVDEGDPTVRDLGHGMDRSAPSCQLHADWHP